eukprot:CAMPEP_0167804384 /NCGR_PEP_ID=MMETSP0111_2-20121227/20446_1 /TAXON_ID=91324 /ORGANISM="Lotharella globosa, Strain CCCM811" /LENGTH=85 /DNA_ID=CAMNT_0007701127 /DNA_START=1 /DNA_END=254 /DNA_ORIENTATION=-
MQDKMKEAKGMASEQMQKAFPEPCFVVSTTAGSRKIYLNFMKWERCPPLQRKDGSQASDKDPISNVLVPISVGEHMKGKEKDGTA